MFKNCKNRLKNLKQRLQPKNRATKKYKKLTLYAYN